MIFRVHGKGYNEPTEQTTFKGKTSLSDASQSFFKGKHIGEGTRGAMIYLEFQILFDKFYLSGYYNSD